MDYPELMKKIILLLIAAFGICALTFTSCDNKPPFVRLAAAIDSINNQYEEAHGTKDKFITYEKWENVVHFHIDFPGVIDRDAFEPIAANMKEMFLDQLVKDNEFGIVTEMMDAKSNMMLDFKGLNDTSYEVLIVANEIMAAYDAAQAAKSEEKLIEEAIERHEEAIDTLNQAQIEQELLEGNAPSIAEDVNARNQGR